MRNVSGLSTLVKNFRCLTIRGVHTQSQSSLVDSALIPASCWTGTLKLQPETKSNEKHSSFSNESARFPLYFKCHTITEYSCLSGLPIEKIDQVNTNFIYECPEINNGKVIDTPPAVTNQVPLETPPLRHTVIEQPGTTSEKLANSELQRRMRSMKKRQWQRRKTRLWPHLRKLRFLKKLRSQRKMDRYTQKFEKLGAEFDAMGYIKDNLKTARSKGYHINIFGDKSLFHKKQ